MSPRRPTIALLLIGLLLVPGPGYAIVVDALDGPERSTIGYRATPVDESDDELLAERYVRELSFRTPWLTHEAAADDFRAPNETWAVLRRAIRNGSATIPNEDVHDDLRGLERNQTFLTTSQDTYYSYSVSPDGTTIRTTPVDDATIARAVRAKLVVPYDRLPAAQRATFDEILNASMASDHSEYRPWPDEPLPEPIIVEYAGTYYEVGETGHWDDISQLRVLGYAATPVGFLFLVASGALSLFDRWRD